MKTKRFIVGNSNRVFSKIYIMNIRPRTINIDC
jgi:hypothetical protein